MMQDFTSSPGGNKTAKTGGLIGWFLSWRTPGRILVILAALATLLRLFYAEENWRGKRDWETYKHQMEAKGVELDWDKFIPPPVPDDQNFAMTPFLAPIFDFNPRPLAPGQSPWRNEEGLAQVTNFASAFSSTDEAWRGGVWQQTFRMTDLEDCLLLLARQTNSDATKPSFTTRTEAATAVLGALEQFKPVLDELRAASRRPYSRFNISYHDEDPAAILVPHLAPLRRLSRVLQVRASAELALGKTEAAFADAGFMLFVAESIHNEPLLISHALRLNILRAAQQIIWEGLADHRWSDAQLREFQARLQKISLLKDLYRPMMGERAAFGIRFFEYVRNHPNGFRDVLSQTDADRMASALLIAPAGWLYQEEISCQRLYGESVFSGFDPQSTQIHPRIIDDNRNRLEKGRATAFSAVIHHTVFAQWLVPNLYQIVQNTAVAQTSVDQTFLACALERYWTVNGKFPETLDSLVPQFIDKVPADICGGQPLKYRLADNHRFTLYSVGWNEKDDGGAVVMDKWGRSIDRAQGDWVWPEYPGK
ncbi:MAG TPA: hypothetical protein VFC07_15205 [Verrucomicrobiae bacterium]|nr:hypothetical protein [Verrucomicrobiae bacterium]